MDILLKASLDRSELKMEKKTMEKVVGAQTDLKIQVKYFFPIR